MKSTVLVYKLKQYVKVTCALHTGVKKFIFDSPFACGITCIFIKLPVVFFPDGGYERTSCMELAQSTEIIFMLWINKHTLFSIFKHHPRVESCQFIYVEGSFESISQNCTISNNVSPILFSTY